MKTALHVIIFIVLLISATVLQASSYCGDLNNRGHGPFDYTNARHRIRLPIVEAAHFTDRVEKLIAGNTTDYIAGDISYTLNVFPNHHRALASMSKLALREKTNKPRASKYTILCWFERAIRFKPDDAIVRSIFSSYLVKKNDLKMALEQLQIAIKLEPEHPTINYNLGLLYFKKKNYDEARRYARIAYSLNFPLPGLKNKLIQVNKWKD